MVVGIGLYMCDVVVKKFTFAISSPDEFLYHITSAGDRQTDEQTDGRTDKNTRRYIFKQRHLTRYRCRCQDRLESYSVTTVTLMI